MTVVVRQAMSDDGGDFISGTTVNKAFVDQIYDQIDDQAHSTTNPTVKPKATTDEVVAARGSKPSLGARLDVVLNADGTLKSQSSILAVSTYQAGIGSRNIALNGDLDDWTGGGSAAPDNFTLTGAGATITRTGVAMGDTFHFGTGSGFAAKITRAGNDWKLTQDILAAASFANYTNVKGQKVSVAVKGKTGIASLLRIVVDDGVTTDASTYHTGGGAEEHLSVTHVISNSATKLSVYVEGTGSNGDAYVGGFVFVFADVPPSDWSALSTTPDANATRHGLVSTGAQTWAGPKTFAALPLGFGMPVFARLTSDFTKNASTALTDVTGLNFAVGANEVWEFRFVLRGESSAAAGWDFALTGPGAPTAVWYGVGSTQDAPTTGAVTAFGSRAASNGAAGTSQLYEVVGLLRNGANAGTVQLQASQHSSDATNSIIRTESYMIARKLA